MSNRSGDTPTLGFSDAFVIMIGVVIGAGIFKTPSLVASFAGNPWTCLLLWGSGGIVTFVGALCYAEISSLFPGTGGEYNYLHRAYGADTAFLFAWARMTVIQTGSIAFLGFLIGDYISAILPFDSKGPSVFAAVAVISVTAINLKGIRPGKRFQHVAIFAMVAGLLMVIIAGIFSLRGINWTIPDRMPAINSVGSAMVFVLLTFGGWNEAVYLSGELRDVRRNMVRVLLSGTAFITVTYVAVNAVMLAVLGLEGVSSSEAVAADMMRAAVGDWGAGFITILIVITAAGTLNAVVITGARTNYALGKQFGLFRKLGYWNKSAGTPSVGLIVQGAVALILIGIGTVTRGGFMMMVEYTAPVFWFFFLLVGLSVFILRRNYPDSERPFKVPLYPVTPLLFCCMCLFMLWSSVAYTGKGAFLGVAVMMTGIPILIANKKVTGD